MSENSRYVRSSSGLWKLSEATGRPEPATTTRARGPAAAPKDRASSFAALARADLAKGNLVSAETNLRLALTFAPNDLHARGELKRVVEARDAERRGPPAKKK